MLIEYSGLILAALRAGYTEAKKSAAAKEGQAARAQLRVVKLGASSADPFRLKLSAAFERRGLTLAEIELMMDFLNSDAGKEALRVTTVAALAPIADTNPLHAASAIVAALMALSAREELQWHAAASRELVSTIFSAVRESSRVAEQSGGTTLRIFHDLVAEARHQRLETALLGDTAVQSRVHRMASLPANLPSNLALLVGAHLDAVIDATGNLSIPTIGRTVVAPLDEAFVSPELCRWSSAEPDPIDDDLLSFAQDRRLVVVLGDPGAGKSTLVQQLLRETARRTRNGTSTLVPFRIILRHFATARQNSNGLGILKYLSDEADASRDLLLPREVLRYLCHVGRVVILFDGLDEILDFDLRSQIADQIRSFATAFPGCICMVTAREAGYEELPLVEFKDVLKVQAFDKGRSETFVSKFLRIAGSSSSIDLTTARFMEESESIADLRANPLLLGVLCSLYAQGRRLPHSRSDLYAKCAEMLFEAWDQRKGIVVPFEYVDAAQEAMREFALVTFTGGQEEISESDLNRFLEAFYRTNVDSRPGAARHFCKQTVELWRGRMWLLIFSGSRSGENFFRFSHRTFLEYFAAERVVFESGGGEALWNRLENYMRSRSAVPFCLLAIELMSRRIQGGTDGFFQCCCEVIAGGVHDPSRDALNVAVTAMQGLACTKGEWSTRGQVVELGTHLLAQLIPFVPGRVFGSSASRGSVGYADIFQSYGVDEVIARGAGQGIALRAPDDYYPDVETLGEYHSDGVVTVQEAAQFLRAIEELRPVEQAGALEIVRRATRREGQLDKAKGLRLAMFLQQVPDFETWGRVGDDFRERLAACAAEAWHQELTGLRRVDVIGIDDVWLRIHLARNGCPGWGSIGKDFGAEVLFVSGWPMPVVWSGKSEGTLAHHFSTTLLGLTTDTDRTADGESFDEDLRAFRDWFDPSVEAELLDISGFEAGDFAHGAFESLGTISRGGSPSPRDLWIATCLLYAIGRLGDSRFVDSVIDSCSQSDGLECVAKLVDSLRYVQDGADEAELVARLGLPDEERSRVTSVVAGLWDRR